MNKETSQIESPTRQTFLARGRRRAPCRAVWRRRVNRRSAGGGFSKRPGLRSRLAALAGCGRAPIETALPMVESARRYDPRAHADRTRRLAGAALPAAVCWWECATGVRSKWKACPNIRFPKAGCAPSDKPCRWVCTISQVTATRLRLMRGRQRRPCVTKSIVSSNPCKCGKPANWKQVDDAIQQQLGDIAAAGGAVRFVTPTVTSPTLQAAIDRLSFQISTTRGILSSMP